MSNNIILVGRRNSEIIREALRLLEENDRLRELPIGELRQEVLGVLKEQQVKAEQAGINRELKRLKTQLASLEERKSKLMAVISLQHKHRAADMASFR